jgi:S-DNA-T family DNA segregation ATPase FtsK/SpoIIIE
MGRRLKDEIIGIFAILGSLYLAISLASYHKWDPSFFTFTTRPASNYGGIVGAHVSDILISLAGISSFALPLFIAVYGLKSLLGKEKHRVHLAGALLFLVSASVFSALFVSSFGLQYGTGGMIGYYGSRLLVKGLSTIGAYIFSIALFLSSLILLSPVSLIHFLMNPTDKNHAQDSEDDVEDDVDPLLDDVPAAGEVEVSMPIAVEPPLEVVVPSDSGEAANVADPNGGYVLPPIDLLRSYEPKDRQSKDELLSGSALLESKLADFSVKGKVTQVHNGPVITMYEFEPAPGVKINRVVNLSADLALALKAQSIRIAALPGKAAIGIEIPNRDVETVALRDTIAADCFSKSESKLTISLGKNIFGTPVTADLSRMPHLLVAGSTGSGKSVALNAMIISLLYKARPDEVKMLMIDPKLLEFSIYEDVPHLISPVVTNPKEAAGMLGKMVLEMERRYRLMAKQGVRNIESFNAVSTPEERLPYIVILIDELADLMFSSASQVEDSIARLAQMARASGIHLILATQRPSVDVITGVIKANFPARIAFHVTSRIDSRTIIDAQGAEQLLGKGDMLFMLPGARIMRVHGSLVTEVEIREVVDFVKAQGAPDYSLVEEITRVEAEAAAEAEYSEDRDEMYQKALEFADSMGEVSISSIQRRLKVGYNRAARIMDLMEDDGLVGPPKGAGKPRNFLGRMGL